MKRWDLSEHGACEPMYEVYNGDWVLFEDYAQEMASLRNDLTAARLELECIKQEQLTWSMCCDHDCPAYTALDDTISGNATLPINVCDGPTERERIEMCGNNPADLR